MDTREPSDEAMERARAEQRAADEARAEKPRRMWQAQAADIEGMSADAVERAAAMGDKVEPIPAPGDGEPWHGSPEEATEDARAAVVDPEDREDPRHGGSAWAR
ncbi:hypothetical protein ACK8HX_10670 [Oryzobacter sp. R7]|uniref:hypothetical protein n=1 Tax=Oryzobacter faecalis TaxID=3388656 RepID=UPI00398C8FEA